MTAGGARAWAEQERKAMRILLFGADGQVGWELQRALCSLGDVVALGHAEGDLEQPLEASILARRPDVIVNAAAYTAVDQAESERGRAMRINAEAVGEMARAAAALGALLVHYSTDYVFDGAKDGPYVESDPTAPLSVYGHSKLAGEEAIRATPGCAHFIFRTSWVYALRGRNFARTIVQRARTMERLQVVADTHGVPASAELLADVTALAIRAARAPGGAVGGGTFHLVPSGATSWHGYAVFLIETLRAAGVAIRVAPERIVPVPASAFPAPARRPLNSRLDNARLCAHLGLQLPDWRLHVRRLADGLARELT
jgi:dTDP-4-dehydrorhamnose reductase